MRRERERERKRESFFARKQINSPGVHVRPHVVLVVVVLVVLAKARSQVRSFPYSFYVFVKEVKNSKILLARETVARVKKQQREILAAFFCKNDFDDTPTTIGYDTDDDDDESVFTFIIIIAR